MSVFVLWIIVSFSVVLIIYYLGFEISEYHDEDQIPKNTTVIIRRVPGPPRMPIVLEPK